MLCIPNREIALTPLHAWAVLCHWQCGSPVHWEYSVLRRLFEFTFIVFTEPMKSASISLLAVVTVFTCQGSSLMPSHQWNDDGYGTAYQYLWLRPLIAVYVGEVSIVNTVQFWHICMKNTFTPMPTIWLMVMLKNTKWLCPCIFQNTCATTSMQCS